MKKDLVKRIRTELGMTQAQFARRAGVNSVQQISGLESGTRTIGFNLLNKIVVNLASNGYPISLDVTVTIDKKKFR
jgi:transcriptional regulator with XRE-family HTH domain